MTNKYNFRKLKPGFLIIILGLTTYTNAQIGIVDILHTPNPYGIADKQWISYYNKTNLLLEKTDEQSFLNYVVLASRGNLDDMPFFKEYMKEKLIQNKFELVYQV